jgi:hypothetical protein
MPQKINQWSVRDFETMDIVIVDIAQENRWVVLTLQSGVRLKFKKW